MRQMETSPRHFQTRRDEIGGSIQHLKLFLDNETHLTRYACGIQESPSYYVIGLRAPGVMESDIRVDMVGNHLTLSVHRLPAERNHLDSARQTSELFQAGFSFFSQVMETEIAREADGEDFYLILPKLT